MSPSEAIEEAKDWLIKKRGYFYRADKSGYTASAKDAGRYTEAVAKAEASIEPEVMSAHHISEFQHELAFSPTPSLSGLTEEQRAEGLRLLEANNGPNPGRPLFLHCGEPHSDLVDWLLSHAEALLSPAPGIDWKKVGEVRANNERDLAMYEGDAKPVPRQIVECCALLYELAKMGGGERP